MKGNAWLPEAMNPSATPFVPNVDKDGSPSGTKKSEEQAEPVGMSGSPLWRPKYQGQIRSFSEQKGFGFIDCQETLRAFKRDVFIHRFQMAEHGLKVGQDVTFEVELNKTGCPQARNVQPLNMMAAMSWGGYQQGMGPANYPGMNFGMHNSYAGGKATDGGACGNGQSYPQSRDPRAAMGGSPMASGEGAQGGQESIEEMLRRSFCSQDIGELIEQYGHSFGRKHVVTALYQL